MSAGPHSIPASGAPVVNGRFQATQDGSGWEVLLQSTSQDDGDGEEQAGGLSETTEALGDAARGITGEVRDTIQSVAGARDLRWPDREQLLGYCREADSILAAVLLFLGIVYSAFGFALFKVAVTLNVAGLGVWTGWLVGRQIDARMPCMIIGGVLFAAMAWPAMRLAVAVCSGLVGFVIGVAVWRSLGMDDLYAPAGGLIGGIFLFMLSFNLLKLSILAFTAIQGAVMLLGGLLGLLMKYPSIDEPVTRWTLEQPAALPIALLAISLIGMLYQQHWNRTPSEEKDE